MRSLDNFKPFCARCVPVVRTKSMTHELLDGSLLRRRIIHQPNKSGANIAYPRPAEDTADFRRTPAIVTAVRRAGQSGT